LTFEGPVAQECEWLMMRDAIEPCAFLTVESLRAGWWLTWRLFARVGAIFVAAALVGLVLIKGSVGQFLMGLGFCVGAAWSLYLLPKLTSQWAQERYGSPLEHPVKVWWGITWRGLVVSLVAAVIMAVPNVVALSLKTAYSGSVLGGVAGLILWLLSVANVVVSVMATGWAMSKVTAEQLSGRTPMMAATSASYAAAAIAPIEVEAPVADPVVAPAPRPAPSVAVAPSAPRTASVEGKRQCPKCGLYETERGSVIGWYCKVCGWREARR
jgi:hypothetical protein